MLDLVKTYWDSTKNRLAFANIHPYFVIVPPLDHQLAGSRPGLLTSCTCRKPITAVAGRIAVTTWMMTSLIPLKARGNRIISTGKVPVFR